MTMRISEKDILFYEKLHNIKRVDSISESAKEMTDKEWNRITVNKKLHIIETPDRIID